MKIKKSLLIIVLFVFFFCLFIFIHFFTHSEIGNKNVSNSNTINLCFTIDNNYPDHLLVTLFSIFKNNISKSHYKIFVVENNLSTINKFRIKTYILSNNHEIYFVDTNMHDFNDGDYSYKFVEHVSKVGTARLFVSSLLPQDIDKILYCDSDTLVLADINDLYRYDLGEHLAAMMPNDKDWQYPDYQFSVYHNSGVVLINLKGWRENRIEEKFVRFFADNKDDFISEYPLYRFIDQDLLNIVLKDRIMTLPSDWNFMYWNPKFWGGEEPIFPENMNLIHYVGKVKPWSFPPDDEIYALYDSYWKESPFKVSRLKYLIKAYFKGPIVNEMNAKMEEYERNRANFDENVN